MTPTTEQLKDLLAKVTPGPWWTDAKYDGSEMGCAIIAARTDCGPLPGNPTRGMVAWSSSLINTEARRCEANATLIALAPTLADEVVRLREAILGFTNPLLNVPRTYHKDQTSGIDQSMSRAYLDAINAHYALTGKIPSKK